MKKFIYEDEINKIEISFNSPFVYSSADLNSYSLTQQTERYPNTDGEEVREVLYEPRSVSINGYIKAESLMDLEKLRYKRICAFDGKTTGKLRYYNDTERFYAVVKAEKTTEFGSPVGFMQTFIIHLKIHDFYWKRYRHNYSDLNTVISVRQNLVHGEFMLPCVWTELHHRKTVVNNGQVDAPFILTVKGKSDTDNQNIGFDIVNHSTGKHLKIMYDCTKNEVMTIDGENYMLYLNGKKSLHLVDENDGSDFFDLRVGENDIEIINGRTDNEYEITLGFTEMYRSVPI